MTRKQPREKTRKRTSTPTPPHLLRKSRRLAIQKALAGQPLGPKDAMLQDDVDRQYTKTLWILTSDKRLTLSSTYDSKKRMSPTSRRPRVTISVPDPDPDFRKKHPFPNADIIIMDDAALSKALGEHVKAGGLIRLATSLRLTPHVVGNSTDSMCPCDVEP